MIIIGELLNASRKKIREAIESADADHIKDIATAQADAGADYIDVNAGVFADKEPDYLKWLVQTVQSSKDVPCAIDSPDPLAIEAALGDHRGTPMINSISLENERYEALLPVIAGTDVKVIALCMSDKGMPETADDRLRIAEKLISGLTGTGIPIENIFVDPLVQPLSVNNNYGMEFLKAIQQIMDQFPGVHTACGLSNISYGLPERRHLNQTFMTMAVCSGLDGAIVNPLDKRMMATIVAAEALAGRDDFCMNYIQKFRDGFFETI